MRRTIRNQIDNTLNQKTVLEYELRTTSTKYEIYKNNIQHAIDECVSELLFFRISIDFGNTKTIKKSSTYKGPVVKLEWLESLDDEQEILKPSCVGSPLIMTSTGIQEYPDEQPN